MKTFFAASHLPLVTSTLLILCFIFSEHFRSGPRPRKAEDEEAAEKLNTGTLDSHRQNGLERMENCPNVNTHLCAPSPSNTTNRHYENGNTNHLWVRASSKSVRSRVASKFYSMLYLCGCSKHVHELDGKETYTAYVDNTENEYFRRVPEVEYSDKPSDQSSVDIELVEMPKKGSKVNGSDSAISMQNSSNDSGKTVESFQCASPSNYSRPDKRLKKQGNSFDKQRSFDSYTIVEGDGNENDDAIDVVQLEHVPAYSLRSSPKSSQESKLNNLCKNIGPSDSLEEENQTPFPNGGSGLFSAHPDLEESTLFDEISKLSNFLTAKRKNSTDSSMSSSAKSNQIDMERKPSVRGKLQRQKQIVQADIERAPESKAQNNNDNTSDLNFDPDYVDLNDNDKRFEGDDQQVKVEGQIDTKPKCEDGEVIQDVSMATEEDTFSDGDQEDNLTEESRADSYDTFKDLVSRQCHKGRKKNKMSRTTTV